MPRNDTDKSTDHPSDQLPDTRLKFRMPRIGCFFLFFLTFLSVGGALVLLFYTTFEPPINCETPTELVTVSDPCNILFEEDREALEELAGEVAKEGDCSVAVIFVDERFADFWKLFDAVLADWAPDKGVLLMCGMDKADTYSYNTNIKMALAGGEWRLTGSDVENIRWIIQNDTGFNKANAARLLLTDL